MDYLLKHKNDANEVSITELWRVVVYGLQDIWPDSRPRVGGQNMGDIWELSYVQYLLALLVLAHHRYLLSYACIQVSSGTRESIEVCVLP